VKPVTALIGSASIVVTFVPPGAGLTVTAPATTTLSTANQAAGLVYTVNTTAGCVGAATGATTIQFAAGGTNDATASVTDTLTQAVLSGTAPSTVTCNTAAGLGAVATFTVRPRVALISTSPAEVVTYTASSYLQVSPASGGLSFTFASQNPVTFTVNLLPGCANATALTLSGAIHFSVGGTLDLTVSQPTAVTVTNSALAAAPVTVYCQLTGGVYSNRTTSTISVTSAAVGGTPFTILPASVPSSPAWLSVSSLAGGTASAIPITFTVQAAAGCGGFTSTQVATLSLTNAPAPPRTVTVTLSIVSAATTSIFSGSQSLSYVKGSGTPGYTDIVFHTTTVPSPQFSVNQASLPIWLSSDVGTYQFPRSVHFTTTPVCDTLAPGSYSATIYLTVAGQAPFPVTIGLQLNNKASVLSVQEGVQRNYTWVAGSPIPSYYVTAVSTDSPIPYSVTTAGSLGPIVSAAQQSGLAYSFGSQIGVNFSSQVFGAAQPGTVLTGTVTLTWGSPASTIVVSFNVTVLAPGATLSGVSPASLPTAAPGGAPFTVYLIGTGFVIGTDPTQATRVGIIPAGTANMVADTAIAVTVQNSSNIMLTINVPVSDPLLTQFAAGGTITLGVCNPNGAVGCTTPSGVAVLTIGSGPIIQAVTSASSYVQVTPPSLPVVAPYDMITIFGTNFCSSSATGWNVPNSGVNNCSTNQIIYGYPSAGSLQYPLALTQDTAATPRQIYVTFYSTAATPVMLGVAPLLIATNGQINALVPAGVSASTTATLGIVVSFAATGVPNDSAPFIVTLATTHPGIFTVGADGQGSGAILAAGTYAQITQSNPAGSRSTGAVPSDTVQLYVTGLGAPDSTADNRAASGDGGYVFPDDCVAGVAASTSYLAALDLAYPLATGTLDGTIIQGALLNTGRFAPCLKTTNLPTVTIGPAANLPVTYAGFVSDSIAGLYQVNVLIPTPTALGITTATNLPVTVKSGGVFSQPGVTIWVAPQLGVSGPSGNGLSGTVGVPWIQTNAVISASQGSGTYTYAITSGLLPTGLSLVAVGQTVVIEGTPAANTAGTYAGIVVTATDTTPGTPLTGSVTFTITIAGGLYMTSSNTPPFNSAFGAGGALAVVTQVVATGGVYPYTYVITAPAANSLPVGMAIDASGNFSINQFTPDGTYNVTVQATDASGNLLIGTGSISFTLVVKPALAQVYNTPATYTASTGQTISTITATGAVGSSFTYSIPGATPSYVHLTGNVLSVDNSAPGTTSITVVVTATDTTVFTGATSGAANTISVTVASLP
jgi:hypothetical protein